VLEPSSTQFFATEIYKKDVSARGELEKILQTIIAIAESNMIDYATQFNSRKQLIKMWQDLQLGKKNDEIKRKTLENKEKWLEYLKRACDYLKVLSQNNCFVNDEGESILQTAHRGTELVFLLGRLITHFPKPDEFRRIASELANKMKNTYFKTIVRDEAGRNGGTQRRLLKEIDELVLEFVKLKAPRSFTKDQIKKKFAEQNGVCALCKEIINIKTQKYSGDHIIPWSLGGTSDTSNCQITHDRCNQIKGNRTDLNDLSQLK
jgi:GTPase SAR1 family protein